MGNCGTILITVFQASEVAKVTVDGKVNYAISFVAVNSGAIVGDRNKITDFTSHAGVYSWKTMVWRKVPEPMLLLGLVGVGGLVVLRKGQKRRSI